MKYLILILFLVTKPFFAQQMDYNTKKGYIAEGYDVVAYFDNVAVEGDQQFSTKHDGINYKFVSKENLEKFKANPNNYMPQYGGYCAYALADKGKKVGIDPNSFQIMDGKLYLFYDSFLAHTLKLWNEEDPEELRQKADKNWTAIMKKE
jgi:YHS domain-containing protein